MSKQLISPTEAERRTSLSRSEIDRRVAENRFPSPIRLDGADGKRGRRVFYVASEVDDWIEAQIAAWRDRGFEPPEVPEVVRGAFAERAIAKERETA